MFNGQLAWNWLNKTYKKHFFNVKVCSKEMSKDQFQDQLQAKCCLDDFMPLHYYITTSI